MAIGVEKKVKGVGAGMEMEAKKSRWILGKKAFFKNLIFLFKIYFYFFLYFKFKYDSSLAFRCM